jgi:hypothetical protein
MLPGFARAAQSSSPLAPAAKPLLMLGIFNNLWLLVDKFFPQGSGRDYELSPYLKFL